MQGEFSKVIKGELKPSPVEVMRAGPRTKQEARTLINKYEELQASGNGREAVNVPAPMRLQASNGGLPHDDEPADDTMQESRPARSATYLPEPKPSAPDPVLVAEPMRAQSVSYGEDRGRTVGSNPATGAKTKTPLSEIAARVTTFVAEKSIALMVGGLGVWLAYIQLGINYEFWRSQGQTLGAKDQFGYIGIIIEVLLNTLLPARRILRNRGEQSWAWIALLAALFCWGASTYASYNFAARNIDDGAQRRADAAADIAKLQHERDDWVRVQLIHSRDGRQNAARTDGEQIQIRENQIRDLQKQAGTTAPDVYNMLGKIFYTCIPTLSGVLIMIAFIGLSRREAPQKGSNK